MIKTIAGMGNLTGTTSDGKPAINAAFRNLSAVAVAPDGTMYPSEANRIRKIAPDGIITTIAGTGKYGFSGDGGPALAATFREPDSLSLTHDGDLLIADYGNHRIRKLILH